MLRNFTILIALMCITAITSATELVESQEYRDKLTTPLVPVMVKNKYGDTFTVFKNISSSYDVSRWIDITKPITSLDIDAERKTILMAEAKKAAELAIGSLYGVPKEHVVIENGYVANMPDGSKFIAADTAFMFRGKPYSAHVIRHIPKLLVLKPILWRSVRTDFYLYPIP
ncbi:hypothetical protein V6C59_02605 [Acinetobacter bereziniae]|uniref:hypothetical protein n=1 Tax=Acinetobacter bereziniae TaxID=106648 RepID=UPI002FDA20E1